MGLALVSQTYSEDRGSLDPAHKPIYDLTPPLDLSRSKNFIAGQPFASGRHHDGLSAQRRPAQSS